ncbi:D-isomer specific 2-hydroxyacid dehydrogenase [Irpex rosettiformis]|uniref:D-isomer specific 2-hydroxyacid dehydrogenase n=1 Tax=Irpex rosettiformis TaxID=378272 RepID=A0ACB8TXM0_9APHY|nr:D-isomer specific 2-hydroxyacid dehydrogenase [Irpex rosettiformis]
MVTDRQLSNLLVIGPPFSAKARQRLSEHFSKITHIESNSEPVSDELYAEADVIYGFPVNKIPSAKHVPRLKFIQLTSAGSELILASPFGKDPESKKIPILSASGVHTTAIPQHFIATTLMLFHHLQEQVVTSYVEKRWGGRIELLGENFGHRELSTQTVGFLGYGHIGRESARLAKAFGANIIVATPSGLKKAQEGYIIPGFGDPDGSIPSAWYSTNDLSSFTTFLSQSDVVLMSLPSTPATHHILNTTTIAHLKPSAVIVNVGRGDAIETNALIAALDQGRIAGAALDVTDPEPLPDGHTLYGRKNVILTPHLSGFAKDYYDHVVDILLANIRCYKEKKELLNVVERERGY